MSMRDRFIGLEQAQENIRKVIAEKFPEPAARKAVLDDAANAIMGARNKAYSTPENNFAHIAGLLSAMGYYKSVSGAEEDMAELNATDVAIILACLKLGRIKTNRTHRDSWVDLAGYAACGYEVAEEVEGR